MEVHYFHSCCAVLSSILLDTPGIGKLGAGGEGSHWAQIVHGNTYEKNIEYFLSESSHNSQNGSDLGEANAGYTTIAMGDFIFNSFRFDYDYGFSYNTEIVLID